MLRIVASVKALIIACHQPKEIGLVAGRGYCGMITLGELNKLILLNSVSLVDLTVSGVKALNGKSLLRLKEEVDTITGSKV